MDAGLYPVLAVIEDLVRPHPVDIARTLTLDRSTVARHLDTLQRRGLVFRDAGGILPRRPRVGLTVQGFNAMKALRAARVQRLIRVLKDEPRLERRLMAVSLRRLAEALHDDVEAYGLPPGIYEPDAPRTRSPRTPTHVPPMRLTPRP